MQRPARIKGDATAIEERRYDPPRSGEMLYLLEDRPEPWVACYAALQHLLSMFVSLVTPSIIICNAMDLGAADTRYVVSMALIVSGVSTFIQARRFGPVGSGLLAVQGTSFSFLGPLITAGSAGGLSLVFGLCLAGSFVEMLASRAIPYVRRVLTPVVSGVVVTLIGLTLIEVGISYCAGGDPARAAENYGAPRHLLLAGFVAIVIVFLNSRSTGWIRMSAIAGGLLAGYAVAWPLGMLEFSSVREAGWFTMPHPLRYGLDFQWSYFIPIVLVYLVTIVEACGDMTATSLFSGEPTSGPRYIRRLGNGVLGDGVNSMLASLFCTFPNTTFSQNNSVIQLTGVASRQVAYFLAPMLILLGVFPKVAGIVASVPEAVLGGASLVMFGAITAAGIRMMTQETLNRRSTLIIATGLGVGMGITFEPGILDGYPEHVRNILGSGIVTGGVTALVMNCLIPANE